MTSSSKKKQSFVKKMKNGSSSKGKKKLVLGKVTKFTAEDLEKEVLSENIYLEVFAGSDFSFKENIQKLNKKEAMNILKLEAYRYQYKKRYSKLHQFPENEQIGFMAQELREFFPECVHEDQDGKLFVNYQMLVPVITSTIKSLNQRIEKLEEIVSAKKSN